MLADFSLAKVVNGRAGDDADAEGARGRPRKKRKQARKGAADDADDAPALTASMGTPTYTAPEIVNGEAYGVGADVFSLGVVLLELFHGAVTAPHRPSAAPPHRPSAVVLACACLRLLALARPAFACGASLACTHKSIA